MIWPLYLDYNATTLVAPEVADAMEPYLRVHFGNPASSHRFGQPARAAVEQARDQVAALIGVDTDEIVFTSCATEANNLAIIGIANAMQGRGRHLITSAIEHPSVAAPMAHLEALGKKGGCAPALKTCPISSAWVPRPCWRESDYPALPSGCAGSGIHCTGGWPRPSQA
jgi:cysteine desulfurase